ncbi:MAG: hypothetical protein JWO94_2952, partial [Verrucomicrobiaceae bacterium]|nr:hypothetical protein [Verrucomicrobiaceae bacterium]
MALTYDLPGNLTSVQSAAAGTPTIVTPPVGTTADPGSAVSFSVKVTSTLSVTYQWKFNGNDIQGQTGDSLFLPNVTFGSGGSYTVLVTDAQSHRTLSTAGVLSLKDDPEVV